ncbi:MAG: diguanylate cyclase [Luteibacter sp.]
MSNERPKQLSRLVDRSIKASSALVLLLTLLGALSSVGLLVAQRRIGSAYDLIFASNALATETQTMRLRLGAWVLRDDEAARADWIASRHAAEGQLARIQAMSAPSRPLAALAGIVAQRFAARTQATEPLLEPVSQDQRERRIDTLTGPAYQAANLALSDAIKALTDEQQRQLVRLTGWENRVVAGAGTALVVLVGWAVLSLRRSRKTARSLIAHERHLQDELDRSRRQLQRMTDATPALVARVDLRETYQFVNATYRTWFGAGAPAVGMTMREFLGEAGYRRLKPRIDDALAGTPVRFEMPRQTLHGLNFVGDVTYTPELDAEGQVIGLFIMVTDVTERKRLEESLFAAKEMAQVTLDSIGDAVVTTDEKGMVTFLNRRAADMLELKTPRVLGMHIDNVVRLVDARGQPAPTSLFRAMAEERVVDMLQPRILVLGDGMRLDIEDIASPIHDRSGKVLGGVLVLRDVSVAQAVADRMRHLAESDALTGLPNRLALDDACDRVLGSLVPDRCAALLYMDLDGFKAVNDDFGHAAGDELLQQFARRLRDACDPGNKAYRLGGDEFVVLVPSAEAPGKAFEQAARFVDAAQLPFSWNGHRLQITLSVGVACAPMHGTSLRALMRRADAALYAAKEAGKNQVEMA